MSASAKTSRLEVAGEPRVQLLPPSVKLRERVRAAQRMMIVLVIGALVVAIGMYGVGAVRSVQAQTDLATAQSETQGILVQQGRYKAGTDLSTMVSLIQQAQTVSTSLEILWGPLIGRIEATLPAGASLSSVNITSQAPWQPALIPEGPLRTPRIAVVTFVVSSQGIPDTTGIIGGLRAIPGYADSAIQSASAQSGIVNTTIALTLDSGALSQRFASTGSGTSTSQSTSSGAAASGSLASGEGGTK